MSNVQHIVVHDYVAGPFEEVLGLLERNLLLAGVESQPVLDRVHHGMATVGIHTEVFEATLRVFPIVGGRDMPMTELLLVGVPAGATAAAAHEFIAELVRMLEKELHSTPIAG